ncbi:MAG: [Fe-Fe] hydrogenase large subunit C-terminal domain-containing protein [bacterium]|nr:[Fe-Fe] hydrogenase large subunit C-terminal domain-containing protein [bacterium]
MKGVIEVIERNCKDCYKCVRSCPVKAIRISGGHAQIEETRCIGDGRCITVCPQKAKSERSDLGRARELVKSGRKVYASLAPSYKAAFDADPGKLAAALKMLGFAGVEETAVGAELVTRAYIDILDKTGGPLLVSACPAVTNLLEKYYPEALPWYAPVLSPMQAHARMLRAVHGADIGVIFIGPCVAKKHEADQCLEAGADLALTFRELADWMAVDGVVPGSLDAQPAEVFPLSARTFPLEGGVYRSAGIDGDRLSGRNVAVTGLESCMEFLDYFMTAPDKFSLVEMMACQGGCISGPAYPVSRSVEARRQSILETAASGLPVESLEAEVDLSRTFTSRRIDAPMPDEAEITALMGSIGKTSPEDELNCGACGYNSCREKAIAVYQGMAEIEMCIPNMRRKAESMATYILEYSPNGIVVVDRELKIIGANPAFTRMFDCTEETAKGRDIKDFMDEEPFKTALDKSRYSRRKALFPGRDLVTRMEVYSLAAQKALVAILTDITQEERRKDELNEVRRETLSRAQEVIDKQMRVAHEIAGLLGETTAESKVLLSRIIELVQKKDEEK